jgi:hypothetical protein
MDSVTGVRILFMISTQALLFLYLDQITFQCSHYLNTDLEATVLTPASGLGARCRPSNSDLTRLVLPPTSLMHTNATGVIYALTESV